MRIIAGSLKGKRLRSLEGPATRPTLDRVKEGLMNAVHFQLPGAFVLDLFGGSGQLALEALSRGAERAVIVESNPAAVKIIRHNIGLCALDGSTELIRSDALSFLAACQQRFDMVFVDPPYRSGLAAKALSAMAAGGVLAPGALISVETEKEEIVLEGSPLTDFYSLHKEYFYGKIKITLLKFDSKGRDVQK